MPTDPMEEWRQRIAPKIAAFRGQTSAETRQPGFEAPLFTNADLPPWDTSPPMTEEERRRKRLPPDAQRLISMAQAMRELMPTEAPQRDWAAELSLKNREIQAAQELAWRKQSSQEQSDFMTALTRYLGMMAQIKKPTEEQQQLTARVGGAWEALIQDELAKRGIRPRQTAETSGLFMDLLNRLTGPERIPWRVGP